MSATVDSSTAAVPYVVPVSSSDHRKSLKSLLIFVSAAIFDSSILLFLVHLSFIFFKKIIHEHGLSLIVIRLYCC
jgi:hypothetical protein